MKQGLTVKDEHGEDLVVAPFVTKVINQNPSMGKWDNIDRFIKEARDVNSEEFDLHQQELKLIRETRKNKFASADNKLLRWGVSLTPTLYYPVNKYYPEVFSTKAETRKFMKRYPQFKICEEI